MTSHNLMDNVIQSGPQQQQWTIAQTRILFAGILSVLQQEESDDAISNAEKSD